MAPSHMGLDWLLAISCLFSVFVTIVYLFYSNRIMAHVIGYAIRFSWWNEESSRGWVSLESFQVSLLAGKIMIKELRYYSSNQSFRAIKCSVTWRYWLWRTRGKFNGDVKEGGNRDNSHSLTLPCRIHITLEGVEWLLYNRTASYNNILTKLQQANRDSSHANGHLSPNEGQSPVDVRVSADGGDVPSRKSTVAYTENSYISPLPQLTRTISNSRLARLWGNFLTWLAASRPKLHEMLPIGVTAHHGAIVCGNASTPSLLVAKFSSAEGSYGIGAPRSPCDLHKTVIDVRFTNVKMDLVKNSKYRGSIVQHGRAVSKRLGSDSILSKLAYSEFFRFWSNQRRRETQYKTEDVFARTQAKDSEGVYDYAIVETIFEAPELDLSYYWDDPGEVPVTNQKEGHEGSDLHDIGNGALAPQYGIDLVVRAGTARYGPWADRQRVELQRLFFPPAYQVVEPTARLSPGDRRIYTELKVFVELREITTFHIPFREPSKDWQFDEIKDPGYMRKRREGGWLQIQAGENSTFTYIMPWVATADGYDTRAELHLNEVKTLSSVNEIRVLTAESSRISCALPVPLGWCEPRCWSFDVSFRKPTLYIIRDHINLLTDLGKDWSSGPPADFDRWIPMHYVVKSSLRDFELNLFLNDHNIISLPRNRDANALLSLRGAALCGRVDIPLTVFRPERTTIPFWFEGPDVDFRLTLPKWNTHAIFASTRTTDFARAALLSIKASYLYHSGTRPEFIDQLRLDGLCREVVFLSFGWVVRHLMTVRDNYFGNFTQFSTLSEYVKKRSENQPVGDPVELKWREGKSNILEVSLGVRFEDSMVVVPAGYTGYEYSLDHPMEIQTVPAAEPKGLGTCVILKQPELQIHLRTHNYSMEMSLNITPVALSVVEDVVHSLLYESYVGLGRQKLHVDGISILANRLFGPQPRTSTYLCMWEIQVGAISGVASTMELRGLSSTLTAFRLNFLDVVNAPAKEFMPPPDPDVTFLKVALRAVDVAWVADNTSIYLSLPQGISLDYNDLPGKTHKKFLEVRIRQCSIRALMCSASRRGSWLEAGSIGFDVMMDIYTSPHHWREAAEVQMKFLALQDAPTRRAWFLYENPTVHNDSRPPSAYQSSMFLPRPRLPRQTPVGAVVHSHLGDLNSRKFRMRMRSPESEEDERISEAERDARLAHSRPATPMLSNQNYHSPSISSSDESDDDDVTTNKSFSDSEGPEDDEFDSIGINTSLPVLAQYKHTVSRFESHLQDQSTSWSPSPFSLVRDATPIDELPSKSTPPLLFTNFDQDVTSSKLENNAGSRIHRVRSNSVNVTFTPLCFHVVRQVSEEFFGKATSMEMMVDSLTMTFINDLLSQGKANISAHTSDIEVSTFRLRILQSILAPNDVWGPPAHVSSPSNLPFIPREHSRILSDVTISLHGLGAIFSHSRGKAEIIQSSMALRGTFSRFTAGLNTSVVRTGSRMNRSGKATSHCVIVIDESIAARTSNDVHVNLGDVQVRLLEKSSPTMVAATVDSLMSVIRMTQETYKNQAARSVMRRRGLLWSILQYCRDLHVGDPLAPTQPSFLVQGGCSLHLRLDTSWKLFMYLRHCLRQLSPLHRQSLQQQSSFPPSLEPVQLDQLCPILAPQLQEWGIELDSEEIKRLPFLRYCFHDSKDHVGRRKRSLPSISFHSGTFIFAIIQHQSSADDGLNNKVSLGPLRVTYFHRKQRTLLPARGTSAAIAHPPHPIPDSSITSRYHVLRATVDNITLTIHPTFMEFLQRLLQLHGRHVRHASPKLTASPNIGDYPLVILAPDNYLELFVKVPTVSVQAAVESMILEGGLENADFAMTLSQTSVQSRSQHKKQRDVSCNGLLKLSQIYTRVRQSQDKINPFRSNNRDILAGLIFSSAALHISGRLLREVSPLIKGLFTLGNIEISVPRSAIITYRLIEEWRTQYLPNIHSMAQDLLADLDKRAESSVRTPQKSTQRVLSPIFDFQISVKRVGISLQVMHGTWFSWDVHDIMVLLHNAPDARQNSGLTFGVQLASQLIRIGAQSAEDGGTGKTVKLVLPSFRSSGNYDGLRLRCHAIIDHFSLTLRPAYMDDILVVQHNLGTHFYDILDLVAENRQNRPITKKAPTVVIKYDVAFMLQGFRVGIVGPTSIVDLTSAQMTGTAKNDAVLAWDFAVSNLALALSHHSSKPRLQSEFDRRLRSAYMVLDLKASSSPEPSVSRNMSYHILRLQVGRMHAVMSPNSIGELGDLVDYFQAEMILRKEQRAHELEEIKNKTKRVMSTFKVEKPTASFKRSTSLLDDRTVILSIADIGIAFPSALRDGIEVDTIGSVPAFLMSIQKATFSIKRHESGQASMGRLSFQFVGQFDQSRPSQFDGDKHKSRNRLLYPGIKAEFRSGTSTLARRLQIGAQVGGFVLDLDPSIVDNVFGLMDVYRKGRERIERLTVIPEPSRFISQSPLVPSVEARYLAIRTSNIFLTLVFQTGKVRLRDIRANHDQTNSGLPPSPEHFNKSKQPSPTSELDEGDADVIHFPTVTVWGEYRATPAVSKLPLSQDQDPSILIFRGQLHSTINQINPTIFPFLTGFTQKIEERLRRPKSGQSTSEVSSYELSEPPSPSTREFLTRDVLNGMQLSFSLTIDSSRLELRCGHNLGVVAALHWESGGFVITLSPRTRIAYFAGSITGLQVDLRHLRYQGGMVQTAHVDARSLAFSVSYCQTEDEGGIPIHSVSMVIDTEFGATLRIDRLQDMLIFKAVYVDRLPGAVPQPAVKSPPAEGVQGHTQGFTTLVLFRARQIKLLADLGHNVAAAAVNLEALVLRSRITESTAEVALSIAQTRLDLEENRPLTGYMHLPDFSFTTIRRKDIQLQSVEGLSKMLDVTLTSGVLDIVLQSEKRTILQYHAKPYEIRIADDWTAIDWNLPPEERTLRLDFSVVGTEALAIANLHTIPKIIILLAKLKSDLEVQKTEAGKSLATSSITQLPKPENTLLEVADAMIRSARSKLSEGPAFSYVIVQHMTLRLSNLRFVLFKNPNDLEMAMFQGHEVNAQLQRVVQELDMAPTRILKLSFSGLNLSKHSSLRYRMAEDDLKATSWLEHLLKGASEATIARVPAMNLEMNSDVDYEGQQEILLYDLVAAADDRAQSSRGIYVSLNLSLYIWAGALVKGLGAETEKAMIAAGFNKPAARSAVATAAASPSAPGQDGQKGKLPEGRPTTPNLQSTSSNTASRSVTDSPSATPGPSTAHEPESRLPRKYHARSDTFIDYGRIEQLGEATPDAKAPWLGLKETVPPRVHEYATLPMEVLMQVLLEVYSKQLRISAKRPSLGARESDQVGEGNLD